MPSIALTGAAGDVGRTVADAFDGRRLTRFAHCSHDDLDARRLDVTDRAAFVDALAGHDVLVHLAWGPASDGAWDEGHEANLRGVENAYVAARENGLDRVVLASSAHVTGMYNRDDPSDAESVTDAPRTVVDADDPVRPDSYYGVAKVACEALGRYHADRDGTASVALRIGWLMTREELRALRDAPTPRRRFARAMWLSPRDCRDVVRAAALTPLDAPSLTVNAVSRNDDRYLSLTAATLHLGYRPRDNAAAVLPATADPETDAEGE